MKKIQNIIFIALIAMVQPCFAKANFHCYDPQGKLIPCKAMFIEVQDTYKGNIKNTKAAIALEDEGHIFADFENGVLKDVRGYELRGQARDEEIANKELKNAMEKLRNSAKNPPSEQYRYQVQNSRGIYTKTLDLR